MPLRPHPGQGTEEGVRANIAVAIEYLAQWRSGRDSVPIRGLMEDAATAEISRTQLWPWRRHGAQVALNDGDERVLTAEWLGALVQEEIVPILDRLGPNGVHRGHYAPAARLIHKAATAAILPDFITLPACSVLNALD